MPPASATLGALFVLTFCGLAAAAPDDPTISIRLELKSSSGCATSSALMARVRARAPRIRFVEDGGVPIVRASFQALPSGKVVSEVSVAAPDVDLPERQLQASSCVDALDAVALIIAISIDPESATLTIEDNDANRRERASRNGAASTTSAGSAAGAKGEGPSGNTVPAVSKAPKEPEKAANTTPSGGTQRGQKDRATTRLGAQIAGEALFGPTPGVLPGVALYLSAGLDRTTAWSPFVALGALHAFGDHTVQNRGTAGFALDALSLDGCPLRWVAGAVEARACASALLGQLSAHGSDTRNAASTARIFAASGASTLVTFRIHPSLELSLRAGADVNFVRDSFEFAPVIFHTVAPVTFFTSLGLGVRTREPPADSGSSEPELAP